jgi:hypothetical protein
MFMKAILKHPDYGGSSVAASSCGAFFEIMNTKEMNVVP